MKFSQYFLKTEKQHTESSDTNVSSKLLKQAGFIRESVAGRYYFLPIGQRVQQKIMRVVRAHMDSHGAQEMMAPTLHPIELWRETSRTDTVGFELIKVIDRRGGEFVLGGTAEEMFVDLVRGYDLSYRDLPFQLYQFSSKFRDELRARGGLLRTREFIMKDAYSFSRNEADFAIEYEKMKDVYTNIFSALGLETAIVESDNGYIGGDYCHEYVVESEAWESKYFISQDAKYAAHEDVVNLAKALGSPLTEKKGIEVGNIFQLGYHYSDRMAGATYTDSDGIQKPFYMGCYGIGIGRTMAAIVEKHSDAKGIIWPKSIAPFTVHLIGLDSAQEKANELYEALLFQKIEVLYDDRDKTAGLKFADADLIGIPLRIVVSKKTLQQGGVECKMRDSDSTQIVSFSEILAYIVESD